MKTNSLSYLAHQYVKYLNRYNELKHIAKHAPALIGSISPKQLADLYLKTPVIKR